MWNMCNSNFAFGRCGGCGGCSSFSNYGCNNGLFSLNGQRVCRDSCGNLRIQNGCYNGCSSCNGCHCCNQCHCGCCGCGSNGSNSGTSGNNTGNGNGGFTCVTFCGNSTNNATQTTSMTTSDVWDSYYSRQYGVNSRGCRRSCCGCNYGSSN